MWAVRHAGVVPDVMCIGKAFASILPMGATLAQSHVFDAFRAGKDAALYYGHTFCGHPLGARLARRCSRFTADEDIVRARPRKKSPNYRSRGVSIASPNIPGVVRTRTLGMIGAADLGDAGYHGEIGWRVYEHAKTRGAYLRPLGDTKSTCARRS